MHLKCVEENMKVNFLKVSFIDANCATLDGANVGS